MAKPERSELEELADRWAAEGRWREAIPVAESVLAEYEDKARARPRSYRPLPWHGTR